MQDKKNELTMNLMYNFILAIIFSVIAEAINAGGVSWPALAIDSLISYVLEMLIAIFLPFTSWGIKAASKLAKPNSKKFWIIRSGVTATCFATLMSAAMSFINTVIMLNLHMGAWLNAWKNIWLLFVVIAWVCAFFLLPYFVKLAMKILRIPNDPHT